MKKGVKKKTVKIVLSDRWLYTLITIGILIILSVGISAVLGATPNPGHTISELQPCSNGEILKMMNGAWACGTDIDTDTKGISSCTSRQNAQYTSCDTICSNYGEFCVSTYPYSANARCTYMGTATLECRCCK